MKKIFLATDVGISNIHIGLFNYSKTIPKLLHTFTVVNDRKSIEQLLTYLLKQKVIEGIILSDAYSSASISKLLKFSGLKNVYRILSI